MTGDEQAGRSTDASSGASAIATAAHSSNAAASPLGEETATNAARSRSNRAARGPPLPLTHWSMAVATYRMRAASTRLPYRPLISREA